MTPFGEKIRMLRQARHITQKEMARSLHISAAYLSMLERGKKGRPSFALVQDVIAYFDLIWDEAEELSRLARLSHPRVIIETGHLDARRTYVANLLAEKIQRLDNAAVQAIQKVLDKS